jgi:hypothetical protein
MENMILWSPGVSLEAVEKMVILKAFNHFRGNKTTTANALGISIRTLDHKLEKYALDKETEEKSDAERKRIREEFLARARGKVGTNPTTGTDFLSPLAGLHMESAPETTGQSDMPVPKRKEIQTVLPSDASTSGAGKNRRAV